MYTRLRLKNFRALKDLELNNLARVNLITGKNNTGKTTLLEALALHSGDSSLDLLSPAIAYVRRSEQSTGYFRIPPLNSIFNSFDWNSKISIEGVIKDAGTRVLEITRLIQPNQDYQSEIEIIKNKLYVESKKNEQLNGDSDKNLEIFLIDNGVYSYFIGQEDGFIITHFPAGQKSSQDPVVFLSTSAHTRASPEMDARRFSDLDLSGQLGLLEDTLRIIEPRLKTLRLVYRGTPPLIYGTLNPGTALPLASMGEGINRIASLILAIGSVPEGVVLIDEIESGLHYSVLHDVWKAIYFAAHEFNVQVFATTHSYECIEAAHRAFSRIDDYEFRLHRLDRIEKTGEIQAVTFMRENLSTALEMNLEVR